MRILITLLLLLPSFAFCQETRTKIGIVDTGINKDEYLTPFLCAEGHEDFTNTGLEDRSGHGTLVASLIVTTLNYNKYCIVILKWSDPAVENKSSTILKALKVALNQELPYLNLSLSGENSNSIEKALIGKLLYNGTFITIAAGNNNKDLNKVCNIYPACYFKNKSNLFIVGNYNFYNKPQDDSNYNGTINSWEDGHNRCYKNVCASGTSLSAPIKLNRIIHEKE